MDLHTNPALLIVDMQNGFCHPEGTFGKLNIASQSMRDIYPIINRLRKAFHDRGRRVIYTRMGFAADYSDAGIIVPDVMKGMKGFIRGTWDADIVDELKPDAADIVLEKTRNSAFWGTDFAKMLQEMGVDQLVVTGVGTNVCVESTVRDAITYGFHTVTVRDASATSTEEQHQASLLNLQWFGGTATADEVIAALEGMGPE